MAFQSRIHGFSVAHSWLFSRAFSRSRGYGFAVAGFAVGFAGEIHGIGDVGGFGGFGGFGV
jgi:hypothetical protein